MRFLWTAHRPRCHVGTTSPRITVAECLNRRNDWTAHYQKDEPKPGPPMNQSACIWAALLNSEDDAVIVLVVLP